MNLRELARVLNLSPTTVSRALNGYPEVSEATRARVLSAAERHHYRPDSRAIRLATGRAMAIGHVIPLATQHEMVNPVFADFIAGAGEVYAAAGYDMVLSVVATADEIQGYRDLRARGTVDGVIVHAPLTRDPRIGVLRDLGLPFVVHGRSSGVDLPYPWVDVNNRRAFERATAFLLDLGHRRIGLVNGLETMDFAVRRRSGYLAALTARAVAPDPALMAAAEMTETHGHAAAAAMLRLPDPPTALLVSSIISGIGARRAVEERGLAMGRDVSVIVHDDVLGYMRNGADEPIFTATRSSVREAGRRTATLLIDIIAGRVADPVGVLMEADLIIGQSTGPAKPRT